MHMFLACCFRHWTYLAQGLVNAVFNETWTNSRSKFECFSVGYGFYIEVILSFSLSVFTLVCFTPRWYLICFSRCVCVCVCVCVGVVLGFTNRYFSSLCVWVCVLGIFLCMCRSVVLNLLVTFFLIVFVYVYVYTCLCMFVCIYIYIYMCVCVCVFVCFQLDAFVREHVWHKV